MVRVSDGKVVEVAESIAAPNGAKVLDLGAGTLIPGLVDAHTTLGIDGETSEITREITPNFRVLDAVDWSARAFRIAAADGTTTPSASSPAHRKRHRRPLVYRENGRRPGPPRRPRRSALVITLRLRPGEP